MGPMNVADVTTPSPSMSCFQVDEVVICGQGKMSRNSLSRCCGPAPHIYWNLLYLCAAVFLVSNIHLPSPSMGCWGVEITPVAVIQSLSHGGSWLGIWHFMSSFPAWSPFLLAYWSLVLKYATCTSSLVCLRGIPHWDDPFVVGALMFIMS